MANSFYLFLMLTLVLSFNQCKHKENNSIEIIKQILNTKIKIQKSPECQNNKCIFLSVWDFDGTILKGDCSEGLKENGKVKYKGLLQLVIENNLSSMYPAVVGSNQPSKKFWKKYKDQEHNLNKYTAYSFLVQIFSGTQKSTIIGLARKHLNQNLKPYFFKSSIETFKEIKESEVIPHIISASPDAFISGVNEALGLPKYLLHGIRSKVTPDGKISKKMDLPITYAEGKTEKLKQIVRSYSDKNLKVYILAAFGNSYHTDSSFMNYVVSQKLPAGKAVAVMINGGNKPHSHSKNFIKVKQVLTMGMK